jgi:hypothetical protein
MENGKLNKLHKHIGNYLDIGSYSADIYFIIKNTDKKYIPYKISPDEDLKKEIIEGFNYEISKLGVKDSVFSIVEILDDNEHGEHVLYFDNIANNITAKEIFEIPKKDVEVYTTECGDYGSIFGFVIELYDGTNYIRVFKKNIATNAIKRSKYIGIFPAADHKFTNFKKDAIYFLKSIDIINIKDKLFIKNYNVYENNFGFKDVLNRKAADSFRQLTSISGFFFTDNAIERFAKFNDSTKKKIINCLVNNPILEKENYKGIISDARKSLKYEFKTTADNRIKIDTANDIDILITILNRDVNYNVPAKEVYITKNKKLIRRFKHKSKV